MMTKREIGQLKRILHWLKRRRAAAADRAARYAALPPLVHTATGGAVARATLAALDAQVDALAKLIVEESVEALWAELLMPR